MFQSEPAAKTRIKEPVYRLLPSPEFPANLWVKTALALANIDQAAQLQALHEANIERQEQERMKMAHHLHDAILNQAAVLYMSLNASTLTPRVEEAYAKLKEQIHQMISNLRPGRRSSR